MSRAFLAVLALALGLRPACASDIRIDDIRAYLFLEDAGKLSSNIVGAPPMENLPRGGGPDGDTATGVLLEFVFSGAKNSQPKYATATIDISQRGKTGQPVEIHKAFANFVFGASGATHKALFLENATCMTLRIDVHAGKSAKDASLVFQCP
jgi:hypothetical protein